jgi:hypothetical protein
VGGISVELGALTANAAVIVTAALALVLGAQVAAVSHIGICEYSTVVVTSTLASGAGGAGFAQPAGSRRGDDRGGGRRRGDCVASMRGSDGVVGRLS